MSRPLRFLIFSFILLASCGGEQVAYQPTPTRVIVSPTSTPFPTPTPRPTVTLAPISTATPVSDVIQPPLPDLLINHLDTSSSYFLPYTCYTSQIAKGQISIASYPYKTSTLLLANDELGFYYPKLSPNKHLVAYIAIQPRDPKFQYLQTGRLIEFLDSDSIWIMHPDGSEKKRVSDLLPRYEGTSLHLAGEACDVIANLRGDLLRWSSDSKWLAYEYQSMLYQNFSRLHIINVEDNQKMQVAEASIIFDFAWSNINTKLATLYYSSDNGSEIMISDLKSELPLKITVEPFLKTQGTGIYRIWWSNDDANLFVATFPKHSTSLGEIWVWRLVTNKIEKLLDYTSDQIPIGLSSNKAVICAPSGLRFFSLSDGMFLDAISVSKLTKQACLNSTFIKDGNNRDVFVFQDDDQNIWATSLGLVSNEPVKVFDHLNFKKDSAFKIFSTSWEP